MRKYIITVVNATVNGAVFEVEKTKLNILAYGIEIFTKINEKEKKFIIPWQQIALIEEVNE